jgi:hypothetical protein
MSICVVIVLHGNADLLQIVDAVRSPGRFASGLNGRQQERHQNANNCDHD